MSHASEIGRPRAVAHGIVYETPKPHLRTRHAFHPTIVDLGGGELLCGFEMGEAVESMDYGAHRTRSFDGGATWNYEGPIWPQPSDQHLRHGIRLALTSEGVTGFGSRMLGRDPERGVLNRENLGYAEMELILCRSSDGGRAWTVPGRIEPPLEGPAFETCHSIVELPSGRWLAPTSTWRGWDGSLPNGEKAIVLVSDDKGRTWPRYGVVFDRTAEGLIHWEQSVISLGGDRVLSVAWVYHPSSGAHRPNRYAVSEDGGLTFSPPREAGLLAQTCKLCRLADGRLICAYRRNDKPGLWTNLVRIEDGAWRNGDPVPLWGAGLSGSGMAGEGAGAEELSGLQFGFPQMTQLSSGEVLLVFWRLEGWSSRIHWIRLALDG